MREILFRGKRKDNGEWIENHTVVEFRDGQKYIPNNSAPSGLKIDENGNKVSFVALFHEVIPETVGQYTGLTDKNGKKIFEGDIHKCGENLWLVTFGEFYDMDVTDYEYGWYCKKINSKYTEAFGFNGAESGYMNIIGNIHDNPELLKGGAE